MLNERGVALFSEPGKGHAESAIAQAAVRDFGVLEQEVMITELIAACHDAGFREVRLKPMSYVIPEFELGPTEWTRGVARRIRSGRRGRSAKCVAP